VGLTSLYMAVMMSDLVLTMVSLPFIPVEWRVSVRGLCSGGKAVDACAYTTHAVKRVLFTKFHFKESVFI